MLKRIAICSNALVLLIAIGALFFSAQAQPHYNLKHYSTEEGLSHDRVSCIMKDRQGFMWFGTWDGINRFDGHNFVTYKGRAGDSSNLENNKIRIIVEDKQGYLWVKTFDNKIYRFDKKTEGFLSIPERGSPAYLGKLLVDRIVPVSNGDTWLLTARQGVLCAFAKKHGHGMPLVKSYHQKAIGQFKIPSNRVAFFYEDKNHLIWLGTSKGVICLSKTTAGEYQKVNLVNKQGMLGSQYAFTCIRFYENEIYFGTTQGVVLVYDIKTKSVKTLRIVSGTPINDILVSKNKLYLTTSGRGLIEYNLTEQSLSYHVPGFATLRKIYKDKTGLLWLEPGNGVVKFDPQHATFKWFTQKKDAEALTIHTTYQVFEDAYNMLWVCMAGGGFGYYDQRADEVKYFHDEPGKPDQQFSNVVTALYQDPAGIMWFSGYDRGINKLILQPHVFKHNVMYPNATAKTENEVRALCEDHTGRLWVGTKAGEVILYKNGVRQGNPFVNLQPKAIGKVYTIFESRNHTIWLGTKGSGLIEAHPLPNDSLHYETTRYVADKNTPNSISSNTIYTVYEDKNGRIWVGTFGGGLNLLQRAGSKTLFKNANNAFKNYSAARANGIRHIQEDIKGNIWIATTNGLVIFNPNNGINYFRFRRYTKVRGDENSLGGNDVQFIHRDRAGTMWLGTFGGGLQKAITNFSTSQKVKFKVYTTANGLPNDIILSMSSDNKQRLWIATENGLSEFNPATETFKNYNSDDGLPKTQFSESAFIKSKSGDLYLGCISGYINFNPMAVGTIKQSANIALTRFQVFNKDILPGAPDSILRYAIDQTNDIRLAYNQNLISINYTVLNYKTAHKVWYAYKLEGYDKQWNLVKNARQATYTNLPPGKYVFRVKSVSGYLFNNTPQKSVAINILPPPWKTWWAYCIYLIIGAALMETARRIILTMVKLRNRIVVEQKVAELKLGFFTNISHELRTPLTLIVNPLKAIAHQETLTAKGREHINLATKNADRMVRFINQLLDFRKLQSGKIRLKIAETDVVALVKNTTTYFTELAHEKGISFNFQTHAPFYYTWVDEDKIDIVIYNLLANAFKYTPEGKAINVLLEPDIHTGHLCIKIIDEGTGVPEDKLKQIFELYYEAANNLGQPTKGTGIGLAFSKELISGHHGTISAANNPAGGMTFTVRLKSGKAHFADDDVDFVTPLAPAPNNLVSEPDTTMLSGGETVVQNETHPLVLIVEDNTELRKFLADQLGRYYRVATAADGVIGLQKATELIPELIISDVMMPNMDGIAMLDAIKHNMITSHIPVVLLTAKSSVEHQIEGMRYGADFYVTKPFNTEYLLVLVENLIKQRKQLVDGLLGSKNLIQLSPGEILITSKDEQLLKQVIETVEKGMADPEFNIDDVARTVGLGRTTFYKKMKSFTGLAPVEFVKEMRLKRSKQLIDSGEYTMAEIAYQVGFSSSGYFSTCFKEKYNQSPSQYLKSIKQLH
ncbi:two-component regulator propeller domain-containing protein [Mucilaginibacter sp. PAMB04168]|uniref:two-component regulator propeller domain-containing protein n=1 Tax=Mucilaginibacter sp. PAMB04168 TaxID=3138567 RepID=UPI0031F61DFB